MQLIEIARPVGGRQRRDRTARERRLGALARGDLAPEPLDQRRYVVAPFAQWRQHHRAGRQHREQRGIEAPVDGEVTELFAAAAYDQRIVPFELRQQERQSLLLRPRIRTYFGAVEDAIAGLVEHLQRARNQSRASLQGDERRVGHVHGARCDVVPRARFADDQNRPRRAHQLLDRTLGFDHRGARPQRRKRDPARTLTRAGLERPRHGREELLQTNRLFEEVEGADLGRLDRGLDGPVSGHHDHRHRELAARGPFTQQRDAVGIGHPDVEQDERRFGAAAIAARLARVLGQTYPVTLVLQDLGEQLADADLVIDDQNLLRLRHHVLVPSRGKCRVTRAPRGRRFSIVTRPWCSSTIFLTMARPRPVPLALVVTYGSNAWRIISSGNPLPASANDSVSSSPRASIANSYAGTATSACASSAFWIRLWNTWRSRVGSP